MDIWSRLRQGRSAALAQAGGEFRIVAANLLWSKVVDHYHHQYLADGGDWSKNESLLPLLHTITVLDPHFVQAYEVMGGAILPRTGRVAEGERVWRRACGTTRTIGSCTGKWRCCCRTRSTSRRRPCRSPRKAFSARTMIFRRTS